MKFSLWSMMLAVTFIAVVLALGRFHLPCAIYLCAFCFLCWWVDRSDRRPPKEPRLPGTWTYREVVGDDG
jgi:hypothetical protein